MLFGGRRRNRQKSPHPPTRQNAGFRRAGVLHWEHTAEEVLKGLNNPLLQSLQALCMVPGLCEIGGRQGGRGNRGWKYEKGYSSTVRRGDDHLRMRQRAQDTLNRERDACEYMREMSPVLHGHGEAPRLGRSRRTLPAALGEKRSKVRSQSGFKVALRTQRAGGSKHDSPALGVFRCSRKNARNQRCNGRMLTTEGTESTELGEGGNCFK